MRSEQQSYLIDGPVLIAEALAAGVELEAAYVDADDADRSVLDELDAAAVPLKAVRAGSLAKVLDLGAPRAMVAVAHMRTVGLDAVVRAGVAQARPLLVIVELADPGNLGTLVRVAEAADCAGVVITERSVDPFNPKAVRASAGSLFRVPVSEGADPHEVLDALRSAGVPTFATVGSTGRAPEALPLGGAAAILVGSEAHGLPEEVTSGCDERLSVPMAGQVESLNAAVAGAAVLFEAARQRRTGTGSQRSGGPPAAVGHNDGPSAPAETAPPEPMETDR